MPRPLPCALLALLLLPLGLGCKSGQIGPGVDASVHDGLSFRDGSAHDGDVGSHDGGADGSGDGSKDGASDLAPRSYAFDLDGDGTTETDLTLAACSAPQTGLCLQVDSALLGAFTLLVDTAGALTSKVQGPLLSTIGSHTGTAHHEVAVVYARTTGEPALAIVDVQAKQVVAVTAAPSGQTVAYVDVPRDPQGRGHPFLAPSYGDEPGAKAWGYLCVYAAQTGNLGRCGMGFAEVSTIPSVFYSSAGYYFREVGGYLQDIDGDGWDDIHLIYHATVVAISPRTAQQLVTTTYDVAAPSEPASPKWFHSGRNYGTHRAYTGQDGKLRTLVVGGIPVGSFEDVNCNVSRFVAVLESSAGQPSTRKLAWSRYLGFTSTIFSAYDPSYASNPPVARAADILDRCVHRFSDARSVMDGQEVAVFNYFASDAPVDRCLLEQYQLYLPPTWTQQKSDAWYGCLAKNLAVTGVWGQMVLGASDGQGLTGSQQTYVWGMSTALLPGGEPLYLVETLPAKTPYDLRKHPASALAVRALVSALWSTRGTFPVAGRPRIVSEAAHGSRGVGSYTGFAELSLRDLDGDGLMEVELEDGRWVGYDAASGAFTLKAP